MLRGKCNAPYSHINSVHVSGLVVPDDKRWECIKTGTVGKGENAGDTWLGCRIVIYEEGRTRRTYQNLYFMGEVAEQAAERLAAESCLEVWGSLTPWVTRSKRITNSLRVAKWKMLVNPEYGRVIEKKKPVVIKEGKKGKPVKETTGPGIGE